jgi:hypothetical protein
MPMVLMRNASVAEKVLIFRAPDQMPHLVQLLLTVNNLFRWHDLSYVFFSYTVR